MCLSDVICLLSGLQSRQRENERCPKSHLHLLFFSNRVIRKVPTYPSSAGYEGKRQRQGDLQG